MIKIGKPALGALARKWVDWIMEHVSAIHAIIGAGDLDAAHDDNLEGPQQNGKIVPRGRGMAQMAGLLSNTATGGCDEICTETCTETELPIDTDVTHG
jgi:hypothetical protein